MEARTRSTAITREGRPWMPRVIWRPAKPPIQPPVEARRWIRISPPVIRLPRIVFRRITPMPPAARREIGLPWRKPVPEEEEATQHSRVIVVKHHARREKTEEKGAMPARNWRSLIQESTRLQRAFWSRRSYKYLERLLDLARSVLDEIPEEIRGDAREVVEKAERGIEILEKYGKGAAWDWEDPLFKAIIRALDTVIALAAATLAREQGRHTSICIPSTGVCIFMPSHEDYKINPAYARSMAMREKARALEPVARELEQALEMAKRKIGIARRHIRW